MLFLERKGQNKQQMLAKRCSSFLYEENPQQIKISYDQLIALYKKRSDFVHEGKVSNITYTDIIILREFVRNSFLKVVTLTESKEERIERLKNYIISHKTSWGE